MRLSRPLNTTLVIFGALLFALGFVYGGVYAVLSAPAVLATKDPFAGMFVLFVLLGPTSVGWEIARRGARGLFEHR